MSSSVKPTTQQSTYLPLPVAQGALLLMARIQMILVAGQSPPQAIVGFTEDDIGFACA
jgi:hypothetical protein